MKIIFTLIFVVFTKTIMAADIVSIGEKKFSFNLAYLSSSDNRGSRLLPHFSKSVSLERGLVTHGLYLDGKLHSVGEIEGDGIKNSFNCVNGVDYQKLLDGLKKCSRASEIEAIIGVSSLVHLGNGSTLEWRCWIKGPKGHSFPLIVVVALRQNGDVLSRSIEECLVWAGSEADPEIRPSG